MLRTALRQSTRLYTTSLAPSAKQVAPSIAQSANRAATWSKSQRPKEDAMVGPRFEQMTISAQPNPMAAIDLIAEEPVHKVSKRVVSCDGGGGPLGHPKVYINLDKPGAHACGYCGIRYEMEHHHH
ncbi:zinc-finger domain-containing protein [Dichotomocladium elegans]|nr:zinc-finger domain-containing protein [Dichotomocladium elegans]